MADTLELETFVDDNKTTLLVRGDLDQDTRDRFRQEVERILALGTTHLFVDASTVSFVDSSGLGALVGAQKRAREAGAGFAVWPSERLRSLLQRTGLLAHLGA